MTSAHGRSIGRRRQKISNFEKEAEEDELLRKKWRKKTSCTIYMKKMTAGGGYIARLFDKKWYILHCSKNTSKIYFNI